MIARSGYGPAGWQQRSVVKLQYSANRTAGGWRAHGRHLAREGAQHEGEKGLGSDASGDGVEIEQRLEAWQRAGDRRLWKMILSPEKGSAIDLPEHARRVVGAMERDLGTRLEWVGIDHHNTDHPHVHVAIRGRDESGGSLLLDREYVKHGVRARSRELATQALGYRSEADRMRSREQAIEARRFGELDVTLEQRMGPGRLVSFEGPVPPSERAARLRLQLIGRLQFLEGAGLATRAGTRTWRLSVEHRPALREMQLLGDVQKSVARGDLAITDPGAERAFMRLEPGMRARGRVAGVTTSELGDTALFVLESTDGRVLLIPETPGMEAQRQSGGLRRGELVTLREHRGERDGRTIRWTEIEEHGQLRDLVRDPNPSTLLDVEALERVERGDARTPPAEARGFARAWNRAVAGRFERLANAGLLVRTGAESERSGGPAWAHLPGTVPVVALQTKHRDQSVLSFEEVEGLFGKRLQGVGPSISRYDGVLVAIARDDEGGRFAVVDTGSNLVAIPEPASGLELGARVRAELDRDSSERRRGLQAGWQVQELEREREHGRER